MGFNYGPGGIDCVAATPGYHNDSIYFDGTITGSISRANYTGLWLTTYANANHTLKFNDYEVLNETGQNISTITTYPYFIHTWNVTDKVSTSGNSAWFDRGANAYPAWSLSALVVEKTGTGVPNVVVTQNNVSFGNISKGGTREIIASLTLTNTGTAAANIVATFTTSSGTVYGLTNATINVIGGSNFSVGPNLGEKPLSNANIPTAISTLAAGATVSYDAILLVPADQVEGDYAGTVQLTWS